MKHNDSSDLVIPILLIVLQILLIITTFAWFIFFIKIAGLSIFFV